MNWLDWHIPFSHGDLTLRQGLDSLAGVGARQQAIPLIVRLLKNPKYRLPGLTLFHGAVDLAAHDRIHIVLGRGLLTEDEAFTIGFTMGSTGRVRCFEAWLFGLIARYLYPPPYTFDAGSITIFRNAVRLGGISSCKPLNRVDYDPFLDLPLHETHYRLRLKEDLLLACYRIEQALNLQSPASRRLLE